MSNTVAKIITDTILERMEKAEQNGEMFRWVKPWNSGLDRAYSYDTQIPYRGVNRLLLDNNEYLTFNKMQEINSRKDSPQYQIRKGAKSNIVCYYNTTPIKDEETGEEVITNEKTISYNLFTRAGAYVVEGESYNGSTAYKSKIIIKKL